MPAPLVDATGTGIRPEGTRHGPYSTGRQRSRGRSHAGMSWGMGTAHESRRNQHWSLGHQLAAAPCFSHAGIPATDGACGLHRMAGAAGGPHHLSGGMPAVYGMRVTETKTSLCTDTLGLMANRIVRAGTGGNDAAVSECRGGGLYCAGVSLIGSAGAFQQGRPHPGGGVLTVPAAMTFCSGASLRRVPVSVQGYFSLAHATLHNGYHDVRGGLFPSSRVPARPNRAAPRWASGGRWKQFGALLMIVKNVMPPRHGIVRRGWITAGGILDCRSMTLTAHRDPFPERFHSPRRCKTPLAYILP